MSVESGKVMKARVAVLGAVDEACRQVEDEGDNADCIIHLPRPECQIGHAHVIDACGAFQPKDLHADTCHFGRDSECDCGRPAFTHCRMCGHVEVKR